MGNPHAVIFVPFLDPVDLAKVGPQIEVHPVFPKKTNVEFVQVGREGGRQGRGEGGRRTDRACHLFSGALKETLFVSTYLLNTLPPSLRPSLPPHPSLPSSLH